MEETLIFETENNNKTLQEQINTTMDQVKPNHRSPDKDNQKRALEQLNPDFLTELRGHLYNEIRNQDEREKQGKTNNLEEIRENPERFIYGLLKGEIFEKLVMVDLAVINERFGGKNLTPDEIKYNENLSNEILSVMQNPSRYGLEDKIHLKRLPDATYLDINHEGFIELTGVGEAKSGHIDSRFNKQVIEYEDSAKTIARELNKIHHSKRFKSLGLFHLADWIEKSDLGGKGNFLRVSEDFKKTLIIPRDKELEFEEEFSEDSVDKVIKSSFTNHEIAAITSWALSEIGKIDENFRFEKKG